MQRECQRLKKVIADGVVGQIRGDVPIAAASPRFPRGHRAARATRSIARINGTRVSGPAADKKNRVPPGGETGARVAIIRGRRGDPGVDRKILEADLAAEDQVLIIETTHVVDILEDQGHPGAVAVDDIVQRVVDAAVHVSANSDIAIC